MRFDEGNKFEKFPFMLGATCLPQDEFENWVGAVRPNMSRPLDRLFCDWVKSKTGKLHEILQSRSERVRERNTFGAILSEAAQRADVSF
jgi:hypothetical protein